MRVLVLGGSRFVGRATALRLVRDHDVTLLNRGNSPLPDPRVARVLADRTDPAAVHDALAGLPPFDAIVDVSGLHPDQVVGTLAGVEAAFGVLPPCYVFVSSVAAYQPSGPVPPREDDPHPGNALWGEYSTDKVEIERLLASRNLPALTILRPPYLYGAENSEPREPWLWARITSQQPVYYPVANDARVQFCDIDALTAAIAHAVDGSLPPDTYNIADPTPYPFADYVRVLSLACGHEAIGVPVDEPGRSAREYFPFRETDLLCDVSRLRAVHPGLAHPSLLDGLAKAWAWWQDRLPAFQPTPYEQDRLD